MGHFSRYVQPGAVLLELSGDYAANALAFENPDGSTVLVIHNPFDQETQVDFLGFRADLKPHSFHTLVVE